MMADNKEILVSICVITYNQDIYIRKCLDSILMQDVNFCYEIIVGDDCSTDSTRSILLSYRDRYPKTIIPVFSDKNTGISANYKRVLNKCRGDYIALCEGDDYWIEDTRLQKQVDFLETHPNYGFVGGNAGILMGEKITFEPYDYIPKPIMEGEWELYGDVLDYAKFGPVTRTVTLCFRKAIIEPYIGIEGIGNDLVLQTVLAKYSRFAKLSSAIGVFRQNGISTSRENVNSIAKYANWRFECLTLQKKLFPEDCNWDDDEISDQRYFSLMRYYIRHFQYKKTIELRKKIRSKKFKEKRSYRYSGNLISSFILGLAETIGIIFN